MIKKIIILLVLISFVFPQTTRWKLIWFSNPPRDSVDYYIVYEDSVNVFSEEDSIFQVIYPDTFYIDNDLEKGRRYYYKLKARNKYGKSIFSEYALGIIPKLTLPDTLEFTPHNFYIYDLNDWVVYTGDSLNWLVNNQPSYVNSDSSLTIEITDQNLIFVISEDVWEKVNFVTVNNDSFYDIKTVNILVPGEAKKIILLK